MTIPPTILFINTDYAIVVQLYGINVYLIFYVFYTFFIFYFDVDCNDDNFCQFYYFVGIYDEGNEYLGIISVFDWIRFFIRVQIDCFYCFMLF